jgi:site-specific DNA-cytosine methylase
VDTTITTLEFCAGYGGIGLGLKNIFGERMRTIAYCELEGFAQANLISKMEKGLMDAAPIWNDLKTFPYESFYGLVDILIAGYPCQPFSSAGKRAGKEDPRHLWPWIADGIQLLQPRMCFFENVEGHISLGLSTVISDLEELGYKSSFGIFSASEVGAVHQRKRVFIMAHNKSWTSGGLSERAQTQKSKFGFNCEAELAYINCWGMFGSRNELGNSGEVGQGWTNSSQNGIIGNVWPSRPGQPQYAWEPPRVVENSKLVGRRGRGDGNEGGLHGEIQTAGSCCEREQISQTQPALGGDADGSPSGLDYAELQDADSAMRGDDIGTVDGAMAHTICGRGQQTRCECGCSEVDKNQRREEGKGNQQAVASNYKSNDGGRAYSELCVSCDNRTDELRLLGNGVVPATAERAFRVLMEELINK